MAIGSDVFEQTGGRGYSGSVSCLQIFNYAMDIATIHLKKHCPDLPDEYKADPCPQGQNYYDGMCYDVSLTQASFSQAEVLCLPKKDERYRSQLMWTENTKHWDHVGKLVKEKTSFLAFWAGISDRNSDLFFSSSFGDNITHTASIFKDPSSIIAGHCGAVMQGEAGYIRTGFCEEKRAYVCSSKPLYAEPDYQCPNEFIHYKDMCLFPDIRPMPYEDAMVSCFSFYSVYK